MKSWRVVALVGVAWLSSCIGGFEPNIEMGTVLGLAILFSVILDVQELGGGGE